MKYTFQAYQVSVQKWFTCTGLTKLQAETLVARYDNLPGVFENAGYGKE